MPQTILVTISTDTGENIDILVSPQPSRFPRVIRGLLTFDKRATAGKPPLRFEVLICSESLYSWLARSLGAIRAEALFVLTNDAWFYQSNEAALHFGASQFRAAETGRYLAQAANTGESGFIGMTGQPIQRTEVNEVKVITAKIQARLSPTFYSRFGYLLPIALAVLSVLMIPGIALVNNCTRRK
ncbi:MAG: nitrilase-related carbon-nitrogen hydrolase [Actinomycetota bacterium]